MTIVYQQAGSIDKEDKTCMPQFKSHNVSSRVKSLPGGRFRRGFLHLRVLLQGLQFCERNYVASGRAMPDSFLCCCIVVVEPKHTIPSIRLVPDHRQSASITILVLDVSIDSD